MNESAFSEDQQDALKEVINIAMGEASRSLAVLLNTYVELTVPALTFVESNRFIGLLRGEGDRSAFIKGVTQSFAGYLRGEAIVYFGGNDGRSMADLMGYQGELTAQMQQELMLDISNILVGACINRIAEQLSLVVRYSAPAMFVIHDVNDGHDAQSGNDATHALLAEIRFSIK